MHVTGPVLLNDIHQALAFAFDHEPFGLRGDAEVALLVVELECHDCGISDMRSGQWMPKEGSSGKRTGHEW